MHALLAALTTRLGLSGALSNTGGTSATVTGPTRTIRGGGLLLFDTVAHGGGSGGVFYSLNGGALVNITEGLTVSVGPSNTIAVSATGMGVSDSSTFNVKRNAGGSVIEAVTLTRIS